MEICKTSKENGLIVRKKEKSLGNIKFRDFCFVRKVLHVNLTVAIIRKKLVRKMVMTKFRYEIISLIKEAEKGKVYLAAVDGYPLPVIVKELKYGDKAVYSELCKLNNEHFPKLYQVEEEMSCLILVEEYIEGELLTDYLMSQCFSEDKWLDIACQICDALIALHMHIPPLIHRDIKPSNIIINSEGNVKVIDFDSSRLYKNEADGDTRLLGTEKFAPPEQYGFSQTDCRSDIYSLGVVLGMFPKFLCKVKQKRWEEVVKRCTSFAPENRYQTIQEVRKEIKKLQGMRNVSSYHIGSALSICIFVCIFLCIFTMRLSVKKFDGKCNLVKDTVLYIEESLVVSVTSEDVAHIPPEWRASESDNPEIAMLKAEICSHNSVVLYCFKDRMVGRDFLVHIREAEQKDNEVEGLELYFYETGSQFEIDSDSFDIRDNVICIKEEYVQALKEGYYMLTVRVLKSNGETIALSMYLYVADRDGLEEPQIWLQNTDLFINGNENHGLNIVLKNDSFNEIVTVTEMDEKSIDESLFQILEEGRVLQFSNEFFTQYMEKEMPIFKVWGRDGSSVNIQINYIRHENE